MKHGVQSMESQGLWRDKWILLSSGSYVIKAKTWWNQLNTFITASKQFSWTEHLSNSLYFYTHQRLPVPLKLVVSDWSLKDLHWQLFHWNQLAGFQSYIHNKYIFPFPNQASWSLHPQHIVWPVLVWLHAVVLKGMRMSCKSLLPTEEIFWQFEKN